MTSVGQDLRARSLRVMPGGVNSPARAFHHVGGSPVFIERALGACVYDDRGREYLDYVCGWGALLLGHAAPAVVARVREASRDGLLWGLASRLEVEFAERLTSVIGWADRVRLTVSGTEAAMTAVRLARAHTRRPGVLRFRGGYHGHFDAALASPGEAMTDAAAVSTAGITRGVSDDVHVADYNDLGSAIRSAEAARGRLAAVIVEPVAANMGVVAPVPGFLDGLRRLCDDTGALLIFDEVVTGCRIARGGAVEGFGVRPDLAIYAKVIGGGMPIGAVAGRARVLDLLQPAGPVPHAGTFAGHPLAVAAGLAQIDALDRDPDLFARLESLGAAFEEAVTGVIQRGGYPCRLARFGSLWTLFFTPEAVVDHARAARASGPHYARFFHAMLAQGIHLAPSQWEANFISAAHEPYDIERTADAAAVALSQTYDQRA